MKAKVTLFFNNIITPRLIPATKVMTIFHKNQKQNLHQSQQILGIMITNFPVPLYLLEFLHFKLGLLF